MRVMHVVAGLAARTGGVAASTVQVALAARAHGVESVVYSTDLAAAASAPTHRRVRPDELPPGAEQLDVRLFPARWPYRLAYSPELGRVLAREAAGFDVVHVHSLFLYPQWAAYRSALRAGVPYVVSPRGALDPWLRRRGRARKALVDALWQREMLERASLLELTTQAEADLVADVAPRVPRAVVPNPIEWALYQDLPSADEFRARRLGGHAGPIVLNLGRLAPKKGLDVLVRAFALVRREVPDALLVLAGPDDEGLRPRLEALAAAEGVAESTVFTDMLVGEEKLAALAAADVFALPSHTENFGVAVAEALAAGLPTVISPAVNLAPEAAAAGATVVCEVRPERFAHAIVALLDDAPARALLGERARAFARRYAASEVGRRLADEYRYVAETGRGRDAFDHLLWGAPHA